MRLEFLASDLKRMLANASLFACKDKTLPVLCVIRFAWHEDRLFLVANNRYMQSWEHAANLIEATGAKLDFSMSDSDVRNMLKAWPKKLAPGARAVVEVVGNDDSFTVFVGDGEVDEWYDIPERDFIRWRHFVDSHKPYEVEEISFDASLLALFAKVKVEDNSGSTMRFEFGETSRKPARVTMGAHFSAAVMPIRNAI